MLVSPAYAQTSPWSEGYCTIEGVATVQGLQCLLGNVFSVAVTFIGFVLLVMLIVASFRYLLSGGQSKGKETARNTIRYAIIGLVVALSAFIILNLIKAFTGVDVITNFTIPQS